MPDNLNITQPQDPKRVNLSQSHEIEYWTKKLKCDEKTLRDAVENVGDSVEKVKSYI